MMKVTAETYQEYVWRLMDLGHVRIGQGSFAVVFDHPQFKNIVVKVVKKDNAYLKFAKFAHSRKRNPWLPNIASIQQADLEDAPGAFLVFMEKLNPVSYSSAQAFKFKLAANFKLVPTDKTSWFTKQSWQAIAEGTKDKHFKEVAVYFAYNHSNLDLLYTNLLRRGPQLVFNDPMSG